jgi:hypothetical protein
MPAYRRFQTLFASLLALTSLDAAAVVCQPVAHYRYVGSDSMCNFSSIQAAIDAPNMCPGTTIVVTNELNYSGQHITIANKALSVAGSSVACATPPQVCDPSVGCSGVQPQVPIGGDDTNSVFAISGTSNVTFANLAISGGRGANNFLAGGGGIGYSGTGDLTLNNVSLHHNNGGNGGGVAFYGDGSVHLNGASIHDNYANSGGGGVSVFSSFIGHIEFVIVDNPALPTEIYMNQARSYGGGIYASGNVHLVAKATAPGRIAIHDNLAGDPAHNIGGDGGGIEYSGTEFADIALPGNGIFANRASFGAGISVGASSSGSAVLRVFSTNPTNPTDIQNNIASAYGGAIYVGGDGGGPTHATACVFDAALSGNTAAQAGGAIALGDGGRLFVNPVANAECDFNAIAAAGAVRCDPAASACNTVRQNAAPGAATIDYTGAAQIGVQRLRMTGNTGDSVVRGRSASGNNVIFSQCLLQHNSIAAQLISLQGATASFDGCTFADDSIGGATVFANDAGLSLTRSIVHETKQVLNPVSGLITQYLILNNPKVTTDDTVVYVDPRFVDAANSDYHLQATSPAIDFAPTGSETGGGDFDGRQREVDLSALTNLFGARDLGAYEYPPPDHIFTGTFD